MLSLLTTTVATALRFLNVNSIPDTLFLSHIVCELVEKLEDFTGKGKTLNTIFIGLQSLFIFSFCTLSLLETTSGSDIWAVNLNVFDNRSLSLLNTGNGNEVLVLNGTTLIDGTGGPQKTNSVIIIT